MKKIIPFFISILLFSCAQTPIKYERIHRSYTVDTSAPPCTDYHAHVCNTVEKSFKLPADRAMYIFAFNDSSEALLKYKKAYFHGLSSMKPATALEAKLKDAYAACMNVDAKKIDEDNLVTRIKSELAAVIDRPALERYLSAKIMSGDASFLSVLPIRNMDDSFYNDAMVIPNTMTLPERSYYSRAEIRRDMIDLVSDFFKIMGVKDPENKAERFYEFEHRMALALPAPQEMRDLLNQRTKTTKAELLKFTHLNLADVLRRIPDSTHLRNIAGKALQQMNRELRELPVEDLKDFYLFYAVASFLDDSQPGYFKKTFAFTGKYLGGPAQRPLRDEQCTTYIMKAYPMEVDSTLLPRIFPGFPREKFITLAETIRSTLVKTLEENSWLSKSGKAGAIEKMATAQLMLVSPENETQWNFNPDAPTHPEQMVRNVIALREKMKAKEISEYGIKVPKDRWMRGPLDVNAYYDATFNQFVLLVGILQAPFFDDSQTREQNLAAIGTVIGHELGHGIDDKGRLYDAAGHFRNWMSTKDRHGLEARSLPLIKQFDAVGHNGTLTLGENTGDNVGLTTSFRAAFPDYAPGKYPKEKLQEFFLQYGRLWCEVQTESVKEMRLKVDPHSLGKERINRQVRHQPGFAEAYSCQEGDPMYLGEKDRVRIW